MLDLLLLFCMLSGFALIFLASLGVWAYVIVRWYDRQPLRLPVETSIGPVPRLPPLRTLAAPATLAILWMSVALFGEGEIKPHQIQRVVYGNVVISLTVLSLLCIATVLSLRATRCPPRRMGFTLKFIPAQLQTGGLGFLASIVPVLAVIAASYPLRSQETLHPFLKFLVESQSPIDWAVVSFSAVILAPLVEELTFRVVLQLSLEHFVPWQLAVVIVSALFAAVHGFPDALPIFPLALVLGYVFHRTRSYVSVVTLHGLFNGYNVLMMLLYSYAQKVLSDG